MAGFTARAYGHGLVDADEVGACATRTARRLPHRSPSCRECGESRPCSAAAWAGQCGHRVTRTEPRPRF